METELERFGAALRKMLGTEPWCIDQVSVEGGVLAIEGWALAPLGRHADLTFTVDDQDFAQIEYSYMTRSHVEQSWSRFFQIRAIVLIEGFESFGSRSKIVFSST